MIIIGAIVLLVAVGIFYFTKMVEPHHAGTDRPNPPENAPSPMSTVFRNDGTVKILSGAGAVKAELSVEIAATEAARTQGLMGRTMMRPEQGMLFLFDNAEERAFWMANTPLPLDILFIDETRNIIRIHRGTTPYSEESLPSGGPAQYVLEINGGVCDRLGIAEGDRVDWERR